MDLKWRIKKDCSLNAYNTQNASLYLFTSFTIEHILVVLELFMTFSEHYHYSAQLAFLDKFNKYNTFRGI
jgi:hypothetical protein